LQMRLHPPPYPPQRSGHPPLTKPFPIFPQIAESWPGGLPVLPYNTLASLPANPYFLVR
jgi:hypothetical protein